ncbi:hypothetical protein [Altererythrobacter sp. MTPC7]|uniref:hypothetical protein n=1 Tax=Altererythrobacter sp. MTPC7 TaxID=3056567 RepID=UPI0036F43870
MTKNTTEHDQRDVALEPSTNPIEPTRTGPEVEKRRGEDQDAELRDNAMGKETTDAEVDGAQVGYGNSRTEHGKREQDAAK